MSLAYTVSMKDSVSTFETTFFCCLFVLSYCIVWSFAFNSLIIEERGRGITHGFQPV